MRLVYFLIREYSKLSIGLVCQDTEVFIEKYDEIYCVGHIYFSPILDIYQVFSPISILKAMLDLLLPSSLNKAGLTKCCRYPGNNIARPGFGVNL